MSLPRIALLWALVASTPPLAGCPPPQTAEGRPVPPYTGHQTELFDDNIEPGAVGLSLDVGSDPRSDRALRERAQVGDAAMRVRLTTITEKVDDGVKRFRIGLTTLQQLAGRFPPPKEFEVLIDPGNPSAGMVRGLQGSMVGKPFVAYVREFMSPDGERQLHFHLGPDNKAVVAAIEDAVALAAVK